MSVILETGMDIKIRQDEVTITTIKNGVAIPKSVSLQDLQSALTRDRSMETPLLPGAWGTQKYMARGSSELYAITTPPHVRPVQYDFRGDGNQRRQSFKIPVPGFLWIMIVRSERGGQARTLQHMMAYALRNWIMSEKDPMYIFPFSNVSNYCCWGSNRVSITIPKSLTTVPEQFMNGIFNSDLDRNHFEPFTWKKMDRDISASSTPNLFDYLDSEQKKAEAEGRNAEFRWECLRPASRSFAEAISHEAQRLQ
jgi:hypothetical protein